MDTSTYPLHALLLLSDSALPLGAFAFSSGLESHLAHQKQKHPQKQSSATTPSPSSIQSFESFLHLSLKNLASTSLPYVLEAYENPDRLSRLDNDFDASTPCTVARRASIAQGKALLQLWDRSLAPPAPPPSYSSSQTPAQEAQAQLSTYLLASKTQKPTSTPSTPSSDLIPSQALHFPPLFGLVCRALDLPKPTTAYLFLLNHAKAVLSASVRSGVMGPYQSHALLAGESLRAGIGHCMHEAEDRAADEAGVTVPMMDLWVGRHELLYSRIFNS